MVMTRDECFFPFKFRANCQHPLIFLRRGSLQAATSHRVSAEKICVFDLNGKGEGFVCLRYLLVVVFMVLVTWDGQISVSSAGNR